MDKISKHKKTVSQFIQELAQYGDYAQPEWETQIIMDDERGHYLLYTNGWHQGKRSYGCFLHLEVKTDGKIYLHHNGTTLAIADELVDKGIAKNEIVLAFQSPTKRVYSGFAV
ncbi:MAG: XisI protein [Microscillaceae bacterium]|jgi:hypothetical protein|nr:XisI protein [Microscillaceae bacterium]